MNGVGFLNTTFVFALFASTSEDAVFATDIFPLTSMYTSYSHINLKNVVLNGMKFCNLHKM